VGVLVVVVVVVVVVVLTLIQLRELILVGNSALGTSALFFLKHVNYQEFCVVTFRIR
jgi:hypothetical protein